MTTNLVQGVPAVPNTPMVQLPGGTPTLDWYSFFVNLWQRTGGAGANISPLLDVLSSTQGSLLYRAPAAWQGLNAGLDYQVLRAFGALPEWSFLDGNSFGVQARNTFFAASGSAPSAPNFRTLVTADLNTVAGKIPGVPDGSGATAGNVGEISTVTVTTPAALGSGASHDVVTLLLTPGDWDVWGTVIVTPTSATSISAWISRTSATDPGAPNSGAYVVVNPPGPLTAAQVFPVGTIAIENGASNNVYLTVNATFTGSATAEGVLVARRRR